MEPIAGEGGSCMTEQQLVRELRLALGLERPLSRVYLCTSALSLLRVAGTAVEALQAQEDDESRSAALEGLIDRARVLVRDLRELVEDR